MHNGLNIGLAWYDREQWELLRQAAADPNDLDDSFDEWEINAVQVECELRLQGRQVERVPITAADLLAWCMASRRPVDRAARSEFAAELMRLHGSGGKV